MYGVLQNIFSRKASQNMVEPYYSFVVKYEQLKDELFDMFAKNTKMENAIKQFEKKQVPVAARCMVMEYIENSCDLVSYILKNNLDEYNWKIILF